MSDADGTPKGLHKLAIACNPDNPDEFALGMIGHWFDGVTEQVSIGPIPGTGLVGYAYPGDDTEILIVSLGELLRDADMIKGLSGFLGIDLYEGVLQALLVLGPGDSVSADLDSAQIIHITAELAKLAPSR